MQVCSVGYACVSYFPSREWARWLWGKWMEEAAEMGAGRVVAAAGGRGLRRRFGRGHADTHPTYDLFGIGGVRAFFRYCGIHIAVQCDGAGHREL
jgi:hypothetical protein